MVVMTVCLVCLQHPLCGRMPNHPPVTIATSMQQLELLTQQCQVSVTLSCPKAVRGSDSVCVYVQDYLDHVCEMVDEEKLHHQLQVSWSDGCLAHSTVLFLRMKPWSRKPYKILFRLVEKPDKQCKLCGSTNTRCW